jgi:cardiolipin synthase
LCYQRLAGELRGEPTLISKLNTGCQLLLVVCSITQAEWGQPGLTALTVLGALVVFTSMTSGLNYVLIWTRRARQLAAAR